MFLDATDDMDDKVVKTVEQLFACCVPTEKSRKRQKGIAAVGDLPLGRDDRLPRRSSASVTAKYTLFTPGGTPVRAVCTVNLEEISGERAARTRPPARWRPATRTSWSAGDTLHVGGLPRPTATRTLWRPSPRPTTSTTRCGCGPARRLLVPALDELIAEAAGHG